MHQWPSIVNDVSVYFTTYYIIFYYILCMNTDNTVCKSHRDTQKLPSENKVQARMEVSCFTEQPFFSFYFVLT